MATLKTTLFITCAVSIFAQSTPGDRDSEPSQPSYSGPNVLSRASAPGGSVQHIRPYIGVNGIYDSGLTGVGIDSSGRIRSSHQEGIELTGGLGGSREWKTGSLSLDYRGSVRHYRPSAYYDGTDQLLNIQLQERLSRRLTVQLSTSAGTYSNRFGYVAPAGYYDPLLIQPNAVTDLFDNRVIYGIVIGRMVYHQSARLSFSLAGGGYLTRRRSSALYGSAGAVAEADAIYRLTKSVSIGADYAYFHYGFLKILGASNIHAVAGNFAVRLSRDWQFALRAGVLRAENLLTAVVSVDPAIAAITGQTASVIASYSIYYTPLISASFTYNFQRGDCSLGYSRGTTPGNGVLLTSRQDAASGTCSYTGKQHWNFGGGISYYSLSALAQNVRNYRVGSIGGGVTRSLGRHDLHFTARIDFIRDLTRYVGFTRREYYRAQIGFSYSPGDLPLRLW